MTAGLGRGRELFGRQAWADALADLAAADDESPLEPEDLERLAIAAHLVGRDAQSDAVWERAHREFHQRGDIPGAVRCASWLAFRLYLRGERARGGGWLARARRLLDDGRFDCVERGYLLELQNFDVPSASTAYSISSQAAEIGDRFGDPDLIALARLGQAQALIRLEKHADAACLLDEVMVSVTAGEVSPMTSGIVYCAVIASCQETLDLSRAREWTAALTQWCESQPQLVLYRGQCLVHRSEIMQLHGAWPDAVEAAEQASERLGERSDPAAGAACYQRGELERLRGAFAVAEEAYRQASRWGREPQPGLALLRLAQGELDAAAGMIRRSLDETSDRVARAALLPAYVEIMLAGHEVEPARAAADELSAIAAVLDAPLRRAVAAQVTGAVLLAEGDVRAALATLRHAWRLWHELDAPYEAARARVLLALACQELGDPDSAAMEFDAAGWVFTQLGAGPDLARIEQEQQRSVTPVRTTAPSGLTARERQVLALVAKGKSNRSIGAALILSEHTVARHVQHILRKLGVASRTAAATFAVEHRLI